MAKRTKLTAPSAEDLAKLDADFRSENRIRPNPATAPIASVAAETALSSDVEPAQHKLNRLDAEKLREAEEQGRLIVNIPVDQINELAMIRDRTVIIESDLMELQQSMLLKGLRLPIEVYRTDDKYGLISGYRRLLAARRNARDHPDDPRFQVIKALVRPRADAAATFAAMVEENEVRANLSHFERGRIAVLAAKENAFADVDTAITDLFTHASPAKRSKVKSFAEVFECLGDMLIFPEDLTERRGLRLAAALRQGGERAIRTILASGGDFRTAEDEWAAMEPVVGRILDAPVTAPKRGRPKQKRVAGWDGNTLRLSNGISLRKDYEDDAYVIRIQGLKVEADFLDLLMSDLQYKLDQHRR